MNLQTPPLLVLDTNVLLVSLPEQSSYHWLFLAIRNGLVRIALSTEMLLEYEEVIAKRIGLDRTEQALHTLLLLPNIQLITPFFRWKIIAQDPDDDKFIDCYVACGADCLVSNDRHFEVLAYCNFPKVVVCRLEEMQQWLEGLGVI